MLRGDAEGAAVRFALPRPSRCAPSSRPSPLRARRHARADQRPRRLPRAGRRARRARVGRRPPARRPARHPRPPVPALAGRRMIRFVIPAYNEAREHSRACSPTWRPRARARRARDLRRRRLDRRHRGDHPRARQDLHLAVVRHTVNRGLGTAINSGLRAALGEASDDDAIVTLEADNDLRPRRPARDARAVRPGRRRRARLGLRARRPDRRRRAVAPGGVQRRSRTASATSAA